MKSDKNVMEIDFFIEFKLKNHIFLIYLAKFFKNFVNKKFDFFAILDEIFLIVLDRFRQN